MNTRSLTAEQCAACAEAMPELFPPGTKGIQVWWEGTTAETPETETVTVSDGEGGPAGPEEEQTEA